MGKDVIAAAACLSVLLGPMLASAHGGQKLVIRAPNGRFLRADEKGLLHADRLVPGEDCTLELLEQHDGLIALKAPSGRFLLTEDRNARLLRADSPQVEPGQRETFSLISLENGRAALRTDGFLDYVLFGNNVARLAAQPSGDQPRKEETIEIYHAGELPESLRTTFSTLVTEVVMDELGDEQYDKTTRRTKQEYIKLPAPTLRDLKRTKKHRILSVTQEHRVQAQLDGPVVIHLRKMPYLRSHTDREVKLLMFVVEATVPARGLVNYKIPRRLSATTKYQATAKLAIVGEFRVRQSGDQLTYDPPKLVDIQIDMQLRDLSNDILNAMRGEITKILNRELHKRRDRIHEQANRAIVKAVKDRDFQHPLLKYIKLP